MVSHNTKCQKKVLHSNNTLSRMLQVMFIHQPHDLKILFGLTKRLIVKTTPADTYQLALTADTQHLFPVNHMEPICYRSSFFKFFLETLAPSLTTLSWRIVFQDPSPLYLPDGSSQIIAGLFPEIPSSTG